MGGIKYNPVSEAGADDAVEPAVIGGKQIYKHLTATGKNPVPVNWGRLGAGAGAGIVAESTTQQLMDATRGGKPSANPYVQSLERLGSRMIGGTVSGAVAGRLDPRMMMLGATTGAAIDAAENIYGIAKAIPEMIELQKSADEQREKERAEMRQIIWKNLQNINKSK